MLHVIVCFCCLLWLCCDVVDYLCDDFADVCLHVVLDVCAVPFCVFCVLVSGFCLLLVPCDPAVLLLFADVFWMLDVCLHG